MAEAMCGPSNALQQFKQQTDVDRTLQQDRLSTRQRHHPAQGFRSPNLQAALLDPDFEAFQAGASLPPQDHVQPFQRPSIFGGSASPAPSWAADFQRLQISQPAAPLHQQQHFQPGPSSADWAQGFHEHIAQSAPRAQNSSPSPQGFQQRARYGLTGFQSHFAQSSYTPPALQSKGKAPIQQEQFDDSAFAAAFDQAHQDLLADAEVEAQEDAQKEAPTAQELLDEMEAARIEAAVENAATHILKEDGHDMDIEEIHPMARMHSAEVEHVVQDEETTKEQVQDEDDALAATAEELLEKVKNNQSDKFKNSQFLGLMRKLRDREVRVQGDKMVETANASSTASSADTTLNASSTAPAQRVYSGEPQPAPLPVDTRPPEYAIPPGEQDHDMGRFVNPQDGQEVVDLLNRPSSLTEDMDSEFLMTSPFYQP